MTDLPEGVVVLEVWEDFSCLCDCRLVYDARDNELRVEVSFGDYWVVSRYPYQRLDAMPV